MSDLEVHPPACQERDPPNCFTADQTVWKAGGRSECVTLTSEGTLDGSRAEAKLFLTNVLSCCECSYETSCAPTFLALQGSY